MRSDPWDELSRIVQSADAVARLKKLAEKDHRMIEVLTDSCAKAEAERDELKQEVEAHQVAFDLMEDRLTAERDELKAIIRDGIDLEWASWETEWLTAVGLEDVIEGDKS